MAASPSIFAYRPSLPGETPKGLGRSAPAETVGPFALGAIDDTARISKERGACLLAVKKIEPLSRHGPDQGVALHGPATAYGNWVIAAKARRIHFGVFGESPRLPSLLKRQTAPSKFNSNSGRPNNAFPSVK